MIGSWRPFSASHGSPLCGSMIWQIFGIRGIEAFILRLSFEMRFVLRGVITFEGRFLVRKLPLLNVGMHRGFGTYARGMTPLVLRLNFETAKQLIFWSVNLVAKLTVYGASAAQLSSNLGFGLQPQWRNGMIRRCERNILH